ncbi:hypothetical protein [Algivirga pacifica]|uniref:hypothetical protein n=1 Tax=Algivirga pacifica TaxID=1162670 RepID=UPI0031EEB6E3
MTKAAKSKVILLQHLIESQSTGTPQELGEKLNVSTRELFAIFKEVEETIKKPIGFSRSKKSYYFL